MISTSPPPKASGTGNLTLRAQAIAQIRHPNLVRMLPLPGGAGFSPIIQGTSRLADFMLPRGTFRRFELERVVRLLLDVLSGLRALHEADIGGRAAFAHGEVSPQHIYLDVQGVARLVPLVGAHLHPSWKAELTGYVAPEKLLGDAIDVRADIFSVGVMLWEALSGKPLFPDPSVDGVIACLLSGTIAPATPPPEAAWARPLSAIAARAIAVDPDARWASARQFRSAIVDAVSQHLHPLGEDWPDEPPTPVFHPRLHLPAARTSTPPPAVLSLAPARPVSLSPLAEAARAPSAEADVSGSEDVAARASPGVSRPSAKRRRHRLVAAAGIAVTLLLGPLLATAPSSLHAISAALSRLVPAWSPPAEPQEPRVVAAPGQPQAASPLEAAPSASVSPGPSGSRTPEPVPSASTKPRGKDGPARAPTSGHPRAPTSPVAPRSVPAPPTKGDVDHYGI